MDDESFSRELLLAVYQLTEVERGITTIKDRLLRADGIDRDSANLRENVGKVRQSVFVLKQVLGII